DHINHLSLHDALPISDVLDIRRVGRNARAFRSATSRGVRSAGPTTTLALHHARAAGQPAGRRSSVITAATSGLWLAAAATRVGDVASAAAVARHDVPMASRVDRIDRVALDVREPRQTPGVEPAAWQNTVTARELAAYRIVVARPVVVEPTR